MAWSTARPLDSTELCSMSIFMTLGCPPSQACSFHLCSSQAVIQPAGKFAPQLPVDPAFQCNQIVEDLDETRSPVARRKVVVAQIGAPELEELEQGGRSEEHTSELQSRGH